MSSNNELADAGTPVLSPLPAVVDYAPIITLPVNSPAPSGSAVSEWFEIVNSGPDDGVSQVFWNAYISVDTNPGNSGDDLIDSGSITPPAGGGGSSGPIAIDAGSWPTVGADTPYYLVVEVSASDEPGGNTSNNDDAAEFTITRPDVDYVVTSVSNLNTPANTSGTISENLQIQNIGGDNGSETVLWEARVSPDQNFNGSDIFVQAGSIGPLGAGVTSAAITISGTWPVDSGEYYLVVHVSAGDETDSTNNDGASGLFEVNAALVDYTVTSVSSTFTTVTTNSAVSESFVYKNAGNTAGTAEVSYVAYASVDVVWDVGDPVIGGESLGIGSWLGAGLSSADIPISAFWPAGAGTYYLIVEVDAGTDDTNDANDRLAVGPFTVNAPPDYEVTVPAFPATSYGGNLAELISTASSDHGGSPVHQIQITEVDSNIGLHAITWKIYQSDDPLLDGLDVEVAGATIPPVVAGMPAIIDVDFPLPGSSGLWYYIVTISAGDDADLMNNSLTVGPVPVWEISGNAEADTAENDNTLGSADDFGILLNAGDTVFFDGLIDEDTLWDLFLVRTGPGTTEFQIRATWDPSPPAGDYLDLYLFDDTGAQVGSSIDTASSEEPLGGGYWTPPAVAGNSVYYLAAISLASGGNVGKAYTIEVIAGP